MHDTGTRVRLFPKWASGYLQPEVVALSPPRFSVGPGPADRRMYAIDPVDKERPYAPPFYQPPYRGALLPPALPDRHGNFDHIPDDAPQFMPAHLFGSARRTLDVWEHYVGRDITWWHASEHPQLELVSLVRWDNAQSGPGFLETGLEPDRYGQPQPFALNFDIIAHETGHSILFSEIGVPDPAALTAQFLAFHESFADLIALVSSLHFNSVLDRLLQQTDGNLYVLNLISRIGILSDLDQIRIADNLVTMADVQDLRLGPTGEWIDPTQAGRNAHDLAQPLTGAIFDVLVDLYQDGLVARGAIVPTLDARRWSRDEVEASLAWVHAASAQAFGRFAVDFKAALVEATQQVGLCIAEVMQTLAPADLTFDAVAAHFVAGASRIGLQHQVPDMIDTFLLRGIDVRKLLHAVDGGRSASGAADGRGRPRHRRAGAALAAMPHACTRPAGTPSGCGHTRDFQLARRLMPHSHRCAA